MQSVESVDQSWDEESGTKGQMYVVCGSSWLTFGFRMEHGDSGEGKERREKNEEGNGVIGAIRHNITTALTPPTLPSPTTTVPQGSAALHGKETSSLDFHRCPLSPSSRSYLTISSLKPIHVIPYHIISTLHAQLFLDIIVVDGRPSSMHHQKLDM